jgi:hypothetical protein
MALTDWATGGGVDVDSSREQEQSEASKMPENGAESHTSGARLLGSLVDVEVRWSEGM